MKRLLLAPALAVLLLSSCKDDPELEAPQITTIELSKEKAAIGQLIILSSMVTDSDTDTADLTYDWKVTDGFSSDEKKAEWVPSKKGNQTITLTVNDGNTTATQEKEVEVVEPDFRLGLWGDAEEDIILSEENAGNEAVTPDEGILVYRGDEAIAVDAYFFEANALAEAATLFFPEYPAAEYNRFITDYETRKAALTETYGEPDQELVEWTSTEAEATYANHPEQWAQAIAAGDLLLASIWQVSESTAIALTLQENGEGGILFALIYFPLDGGRHASDLRKGDNTYRLEEFKNKLKGIKLQK